MKVSKIIDRQIKVPGTNIILEKGDRILYEKDYVSSLKKLGVSDKVIREILNDCWDDTIKSAIQVGEAFRDHFIFSSAGMGMIELYDPQSGVTVVVIGKDELEVTTELESFVFDGSSAVRDAIKNLKRYIR